MTALWICCAFSLTSQKSCTQAFGICRNVTLTDLQGGFRKGFRGRDEVTRGSIRLPSHLSHGETNGVQRRDVVDQGGVPLFVGCKWASSSHPPQANRTRTRSRQRARNFGIGTNGADGRSSKIPSWPDSTAAMLGIHFNGAAPSMDKDRTVPPLPLGASTLSALRRNGEVYVDFGRKKAVHGLNRRRLIEASRSGFV